MCSTEQGDAVQCDSLLVGRHPCCALAATHGAPQLLCCPTAASLTPLREQADRRLQAAQLGMLCGCIRPWAAYASRKISQRATVVRQNRHKEHRKLGMIVVNWAAYSCQLQRSRRLLVCAILGAQLRVERQCLWKWRSVLQDCISRDNATSGRHGTDSLDHSLTEPDELDHSLVSITQPQTRTGVSTTPPRGRT